MKIYSHDTEIKNQVTLDEYNGKVVNMDYDFELAAQPQMDGTWKSVAYSVCMPYDFNYYAYYPEEQVDVYKLDFVDNFYNEFIFSKTDGNVAAGQPCLVVVNKGTVSLNAIQTLVTNQPKSIDVYAYGNDAEPAVVGTWSGVFDTTSSGDEKLANAFVMFGDGHWKPFPNDGSNILSTCNSYLKMNEMPEKTDFKPMVRQEIKTAEVAKRAQRADADEHDGLKRFPADLYYSSVIQGTDPTGITTIRTIESDGTSRYFDLQGRQLNGKPDKGVYIVNGKKYSK